MSLCICQKLFLRTNKKLGHDMTPTTRILLFHISSSYSTVSLAIAVNLLINKDFRSECSLWCFIYFFHHPLDINHRMGCSWGE